MVVRGDFLETLFSFPKGGGRENSWGGQAKIVGRLLKVSLKITKGKVTCRSLSHTIETMSE